ncbi:MAG: hypothetical protein PWP71_2700, partial [Clostridia bacterium]|nr:hypothetical protein [Clostridia bacterium]
MIVFEINTPVREVMVDITDMVMQEIRKSGIVDGACVIFVPHTTAGVTINENADPTVREDIMAALER